MKKLFTLLAVAFATFTFAQSGTSAIGIYRGHNEFTGLYGTVGIANGWSITAKAAVRPESGIQYSDNSDDLFALGASKRLIAGIRLGLEAGWYQDYYTVSTPVTYAPAVDKGFFLGTALYINTLNFLNLQFGYDRVQGHYAGVGIRF